MQHAYQLDARPSFTAALPAADTAAARPAAAAAAAAVAAAASDTTAARPAADNAAASSVVDTAARPTVDAAATSSSASSLAARRLAASQARQAAREAMNTSMALTGPSLDAMLARVARNELTVLDFTEHPALQREVKTWLPERQSAAIRTLCGSPVIEEINLFGCGLRDDVAPALAELVRAPSSVLARLSIEGNDLRAPGLVQVVGALKENTTLREFRLDHQKITPIATEVEDAVAAALEKNTTLVKLGLTVRHELTRKIVEERMFRNVDLQRQARRSAAGAGGSSAPTPPSCTSAAAPRRRSLDGKLGAFAAQLDNQLEAGLKFKPSSAELASDAARISSGEYAEPSYSRSASNLAQQLKEVELLELIAAFASGSAKVTDVDMSMCGLGDSAAVAWAAVLDGGGTALRSLNLEGNRIGQKGMLALANAAARSTSLTELKVSHQSGGAKLATDVEGALAAAAEGCATLQKLTADLSRKEMRDRLDKAISRNRDAERQRRRASAAGASAAAPPAAVPTLARPPEAKPSKPSARGTPRQKKPQNSARGRKKPSAKGISIAELQQAQQKRAAVAVT